MIDFTRIVQEDVAGKLDPDFLREILKEVPGNYFISFVCVNNDWRKNDTWKSKGTRYHRIVLPYEKVKNMGAEEVRQWMLRLVEERLGLVNQA